jgi:cardiolipin synthase
MMAAPALQLRHLPNLISALRIVLVAPLLAAIATRRDEAALALALAAGISDGLDGFLARRFHWQSRLGSILDPAADKLMLVGAMLVLGLGHAVPWWLVALVVARDAVIAAGALAWYAAFRHFDAHPSWLSKTTTVVQIGYVLLVLAGHVFGVTPPAHAAAWVVAAFTLASGLDYVLRWGWRAQRGWHARRSA